MASMNTGRLPSRVRMFVQRTPRSTDVGSSNRSTTTGCSLLRWSTTLRITGPWWAPAPPSGGTRWSRLGVVEVDDQAHPPGGHPDADTGAIVLAVHHVHVVAAVVG